MSGRRTAGSSCGSASYTMSEPLPVKRITASASSAIVYSLGFPMLTGSGSDIVYEALPQDDPAVRRPDIRLAQELLGWEPTVGLDDGLRMTIAAMEDRGALARERLG